jgi:dTDP-4-dehydrorhamnose 3,5-epimerase
MRTIATGIAGLHHLVPVVHGDERGFFLESYNQRTMAGLGVTCTFVQDNHSRSAAGVLRGLHLQTGDSAQDKLVRVVAGAAWDVAVDLRQGSPTCGRWYGAELSAANKEMLLIPRGFAHGFLALVDGTEFLYKCSAMYDPASERGVLWDDPDLAIAWPLPGPPILSARDRAWPRWADAHDLRR